ncbi:MAG: hypothetical protein HYZ17_02375 [Betaproteobacteria bacterium]|nr:hypothetical protein [Betaproteobacteria bacterium]
MKVASTEKEAVGRYRTERYSSKQALHKSLKIALAILVVALLSIVLPGIHFVSVPLGILAAPFLGVYYYRKLNGAPKSMAVDFSCPDCQASNQVAAPRICAYYEARCVSCQQELRLTPL